MVSTKNLDPRLVTTLLTLWILVSAVTQFFFLSFYENTPGKRALGLRLVSARPQGHITFAQNFIRTFTWWLGALSFGTGWSTALTRSDRRAWHDLAAETIVVSDKAALPHYPSSSQRTFGEGWLIGISSLFSLVLVFALLLQLNHLKSTGDKRSFAEVKNADTMHDSLEKNSWVLLADGALTESDTPLTGDRKRLNQLMSTFAKARKLALGDRYNFYKVNMEETEDEICRQGVEAQNECQSARLLVNLLTANPSKGSYDQALPGLVALLQVETAGKLGEQIKLIEENLHQLPAYASEAFAYRSSETKLFMRAGQFKRARDFVVSDLNKLHDSRFIADEEVFSHLYINTACQAVALSDCHFDPKSACLENPFWKDWSQGCESKSETSLNKSAQLGYWWAKLHVDGGAKTEELSSWNTAREGFSTPEKTFGEANEEFAQSLLSAFDFVVATKQPAPKDLMARARKLSPQSLLWGWAHQQALDTMGRQWSYLVYPQEQKLLIQFEILDPKVYRAIASVEKEKPTFHLTPQLTIEK